MSNNISTSPNASRRSAALQPRVSQRVNNIKISFWNAAGVKKKLNELNLYLVKHDIDIMLVSETHLIDSDSIAINGYIVYLANHPSNRRRGVSLQNGRHINIVAIYCPPQLIWSGQDFNNLLLALGDTFIVGGDWNAKSQWWGNARSCIRGRTLVNSILQVNCNILATGSPTHYPFNARQTLSAIDFALFKGIRRELLAISDSFELSSDHLPLQVQLVEKPITSKAKGHLLHLNANINRFQSYLNDRILLNTEINSEDDVDDAVNIFVKNIEDAANYANPQSPRKITRARFRVNRQTLQLVEAHKQIKRYLVRNRNPLAKQLCNRLSNRIRKELIDARQKYSMQKLWRLTNEIKRQPAPNLPLLKSSSGNGSNAHNVWCKTTAEKAETFAASLEQRFHPIVTTSPSDLAEIEAQ
ncbi:uncharacterized protein Dmoj_GI25548, partial [Drosophila mojavensis]